MLNLINAVTITRESITNDGMGGTVTVATTTTVARANIWQPGSNSRLLSDKVAKESTDILVFEPGDYPIMDTDAYATYNGKTYQLTGTPDDVASRGQMFVVGMKRIV
jgi:hypothetical protein